MKRVLYLVALVLAVAFIAGCSTEWEETTLTVVNNAGEDINIIQVGNGFSGRDVGYNVLTENLADGKSIVIPLVPVLHEESVATIFIQTEYLVRTNPSTPLTLDSDFTYEEGAEVVITFNGNDNADIDGGEFVQQL